jgi:aspartyl-tRNA(Asn)/glutamyl-tRNA(Gln) amidotransferase subunit A
MTENLYGSEARGKFEQRRIELNNRMAQIFSEVDLIITPTNPDIAFDAEGPLPDTFGGIVASAFNNGVLTFPANIYGNPGISVPVGLVDGLPVGMQIMARHFEEPLLLELALAVERTQPWPLVAP